MARCTWTLASLVLVLALQKTLGNRGESLEDKKTLQKSNDLEKIIREKTEAKIKKLEQQFKSIYTKFSSTNGKHDRKQEERYLEDLTKVAKQRIEYRTGENTAYMRRRTKRSDKFGACKPICRHKCIPECNLACCVAPPVRMPLETIFSMERMAVKKLKRYSKKKKTESPDKKSLISKVDMEKGSICKPSCKKQCLPSCKFRCCMSKH